MKANNKVNPVAAAGNAIVDEKSSELGAIRIHDNVIAALVAHAVRSVSGVTRLAGSALIDTLAGMAGSHSRAIAILKDEKTDQISLEVKVNLAFGSRIPEIAPQIQRAVIEQVESSTGLQVSGVNVIVQMLEEPVDVPAESEEVQNSGADLATDAMIQPL